MSDLAGRKVFKVFNQEFIVDERYNVTKELGQGAYGIVWYVDIIYLPQVSDLALLAPAHNAVENIPLIEGLRADA